MNDEDRIAEIAARVAKSYPRCAWTYISVDGTPMECLYPKTVDWMHEDHEFTYRPGWASDAAFLSAQLSTLREAHEEMRKALETAQARIAEMEALEAKPLQFVGFQVRCTCQVVTGGILIKTTAICPVHG